MKTEALKEKIKNLEPLGEEQLELIKGGRVVIDDLVIQ